MQPLAPLARRYRKASDLAWEVARTAHDAKAMQALAPLSPAYVPWTRFSMRPGGIVTILNDIVINRRTRIVECGGGLSTLYVARLLREREGHLHTVEHDEQWAAILQESLDREGLSDRVTLVVAPLGPSPLAWEGEAWYAQDRLEGLTGGDPIDLLVVDGPPAWSQELMHSRYPAVPYFRQALATDYTVILDDITRAGEAEVLERWEQELGASFERRVLEAGVAVGGAGSSSVV